ncbi:hypothetical protein AMECASPLE_004762 [Ameca splendens]|uniref:Uncharacterized protein n=1 Tax=Ameca splendens TaxID=208324 RepID=A0ABV0YWZ0_9TELE
MHFLTFMRNPILRPVVVQSQFWWLYLTKDVKDSLSSTQSSQGLKTSTLGVAATVSHSVTPLVSHRYGLCHSSRNTLLHSAGYLTVLGMSPVLFPLTAGGGASSVMCCAK